MEQLAWCCDRNNEHFGCIKCGEFYDELRKYWLLKKRSPYSLKVVIRVVKADSGSGISGDMSV